MGWVTHTTTWLYISTQNVWIVFLLYLAVSKYGSIKMGPEDEGTEFTNLEWFSMIFCCGVATGLFYFSVGEPINHYEPCGKWAFSGPIVSDGVPDFGQIACLGTPNWANRMSHLPDNERAAEAMNLTLYHWGLHGWVCYGIVGALLGVLHWRKGLPLTIKTCFYPLIGDRVFGFWGDFIDVISVVCTTFGICTSLGMGVQQINAGIHRLNSGKNWLGHEWYGEANMAEWYEADGYAKSIFDAQKESWRLANPWGWATARLIEQHVTEIREQIFLIWVITGISTFSICSGLKIGVKWLSIIAWVLGIFTLWIVFALDDTWFICNLMVQAIGHYINYLPQVGHYTGAFDQPEHSAPDGRQEYGAPSGYSWMNDWTIFYWGWWISWAPFVGVFLARISKGRTIRELITTCLIIAVSYNFFWLLTWGGAALKMEMAAEKAGIDCSDGYTKNYCRPDPTPAQQGRTNPVTEPVYFCSSVTRLSCHYFDYPPMMFDVVNQYQNLGTFMSVIIIICLFLYFITSSDSGSLVDTIISANGISEPCIGQRVWWSLTEGLSATGLMYSSLFDVSDRRGTMKALQAASIAAGLPYTVLVCFMCVALWKTVRYEFEEDAPGLGFKSSVLDFGITLYRGVKGPDLCFNLGGPLFNGDKLSGFCKNLFFPFSSLRTAMEMIARKRGQKVGSQQLLVAAVVGILVYYVGWLLVFLDFVPIEEGGYVVLPKWNGTYSLGEEKVSTRYGHFRLYTNPWAPNEVATYANNPLTDHKESMAMGDRVGAHMQLAVFGWFFLLGFGAVVTVIRTSAREVLRIKGTLVDDALCSLFFWPTVLYQINEALAAPVSEGYDKNNEDVKTLSEQSEGTELSMNAFKEKINSLESKNKVLDDQVASLQTSVSSLISHKPPDSGPVPDIPEVDF
jgi:choline-glycine betaine transporter